MRSSGFAVLAPLAAAALLAGCQESALAPHEAVESLSAAVSADVDGSWSFTRVLQLTAPEWVARDVFGVEPEGPVTHIRCETDGSMEIVQSGTTFSGVAAMDNSCRTHGGQVFESDAVVADILIVDGVIRGRSLAWTFIEDGFLICPHHAVLAPAGTMQGTGRCIVPGHPQGPVPAPPPPAGTSKTISFTAWRN